MKTFKPGQKVQNQYGDILTVLFQRDIQVFVREQANQWYHPSKLYSVKEKS